MKERGKEGNGKRTKETDKRLKDRKENRNEQN